MTTTARVTPVGIHLDDGHSTKIAFAADSNLSIWEKTVKPFGFDSGEVIDVTTMFNVTVRTKVLRQLYDLTPITGTAGYDPSVLDQILALAGVNGWVTIHHPNGDTWDFVGGLQMFDPPEHTEGEFPLASYTIVPTNRLAGVETIPVFTDNST